MTTGALSNTKFSDLKPALHPTLLKILDEVERFEFMTTVQAYTIPIFMENKDVMCEAVTGSGKTLAFLLPALHKMILIGATNKISFIVISPTRELASQTHQVLMRFLDVLGKFTAMTCIGGVTKIKEDVESLENSTPDVIIATPGRMDDLIKRSDVLKSKLKTVEMLIVDEADQILDIGFERSINFILAHLPKQRRTGLFSATLNENVIRLKKAGLRNPHSISVREKARENLSTPQELKLMFSVVEPRHKLSYLVSILKKRRKSKSLVYFLSADQVDYFHQLLRQLVDYPVIKCHGKKNQKLRSKAVKEFTERKDGAVMVTTDLLCRGVDISGGVDFVVQFDPPSHAPNFVHRAGRTARAGKKGENLIFLTESEYENNYLEFIKINQKVGDMAEFKEDFDMLDIEKLRQVQIKDKRNFEYAMRAFPSFVCAYKAHPCKYIFREKDLVNSIGDYAHMFGLLKMPRMAELKNIDYTGFVNSDVDIATLQYKDKSMRVQRAMKEDERLEKRNKEADRKKKEKTQAWSQQKLAKHKKADKRARKAQREETTLAQVETDIKELNDDYGLLKKRKRGKITEEELDSKLGMDCS